MNVLRFLKNWILPLSMIVGVVSYFIASEIPFFYENKVVVLDVVHLVQPTLIFAMLFLSFCKIDIREMRLRRWYIWLLLIQLGLFFVLTSAACLLPDIYHGRVVIEAAMICIICPTATAAAVIVRKLGGSAADVVTYTILVNLSAAIAVPLCVPLIHPQVGVGFLSASCLIVKRVFPLLLCPLFCALILRSLFPALHQFLSRCFNLSFYLWTIALALAISVTTRTIVHTTLPITYQIGIAIVSLVCCVVQFAAGKAVGRHYNDMITAGQALGQKNTVFAIWLGFTFFTPITSIAGGFYSIWHNVINSYQLYKNRANGD